MTAWASAPRDKELSRMGHDSVLFAKNGKVNRGYIFSSHQIKSAIGNRGTYDPKNPDITMAKGGEVPSLDAMKYALTQRGGMHSPLEKAAINVPRTKGTPAEFLAEASKQPGYRPQEVEDRGISLPQQKMSKEEFLAHLAKHPAPDVQDVMLGEPEIHWNIYDGDGVLAKPGLKSKQAAEAWVKVNQPYHGSYSIEPEDVLEKKTPEEIAKECGVSLQIIYIYLKRI